MQRAHGTFPFGLPSTERAPRTPEGTHRTKAFVLGVYPSALHVRWRRPAWAVEQGGPPALPALAVDVEPEVFWDGADAGIRVAAWQAAVAFVDGDEPGQWGTVSAATLNGTSGIAVRDRILTPLGIEPSATWFTDAVPWFFVKRNAPDAKKRQQGDAIDQDYSPLAGMPPCDLPSRPAPSALVQLALETQRERLRTEIVESGSPLLLTVGEEARKVALGIADVAQGAPTCPLRQKGYGVPGQATIASATMNWMALVHPGQRLKKWATIHGGWMSKAAASTGKA